MTHACRCLLVACCLLLTLQAMGGSVESAREKMLNGFLEDAELELRELLKKNYENTEARRLLHRIQQLRNERQAKKLVKQALVEINYHNFQRAWLLLKQALKLDAANRRARELFMALHDIRGLAAEKARQAKRAQELEDRRKKAAAERRRKHEARRQQQQKERIRKGEAPRPRREQLDELFLRLALGFSWSESDYVLSIDTRLSFLTAGLDLGYYFPFTGRHLGVRVDYSGMLFKTQGVDEIDFTTHRVNAFLDLRLVLFQDKLFNRTLLGLRGGYHLFHLQNNKPAGIYRIKQLGSGFAGVQVREPLFYRFLHTPVFREVELEFRLEYIFLPGVSGAPTALRWYAGMGMQWGQTRISFGYDSYAIYKESTTEQYASLLLGFGYQY